MPISIEQFNRADSEDLKTDNPYREEDRLVEFLTNHPEQAFTLRELSSQTNMPLLELAARLNYLANEGIVRHRGRYWAIAATRSDSEIDTTSAN
jgi:predicted Rossmann fold nucleotide-binding protein DprA/Smf involved in DNA uptake